MVLVRGRCATKLVYLGDAPALRYSLGLHEEATLGCTTRSDCRAVNWSQDHRSTLV